MQGYRVSVTLSPFYCLVDCLVPTTKAAQGFLDIPEAADINFTSKSLA